MKNKYQEALKTLLKGYKNEEVLFEEISQSTWLIKELIDKSAPKSNEISMSKETFIDLCRGDIGVMDITGQTLYELTGNFRDYDESLDGGGDEED